MTWMTGLWLSLMQFFSMTVSPGPSTIWVVQKDWQSSGKNAVVFEATSTVIPELCRQSPDSTIELPQIIHGVHEIRSHQSLIFQSGDSSFKRVSNFYEHPIVPCSLIKDAEEILWTITSSTKFFARFDTFPMPENKFRWTPLMDITLNVLMVGVLFFLSSLAYLLFWKRIDRWLILSVVLSSIFSALYTMNCVAPSFGLPLSMLASHKFADISLTFATIFFFAFHTQMGFLPKSNFWVLLTGLLTTIALIAIADSSDRVQMGTNLGIIVSVLGFLRTIAGTVGVFFQNDKDKFASLLSLASVLFQIGSGMFDILHIFGFLDTSMIMSFGFSVSFLLLLLIANNRIEQTYRERDSLMHNLEEKVNEKTLALTNALQELKHSQAELIQTSKLASLGTLSAGIAHEINNSINFVNGAVIPLERKVMPWIPTQDQEGIKKLFAAIKHGTEMTVQIVRSLRSFTGLNQAEFKDVSILEIVQSVLTILKSKLSGVHVDVQIDPHLKIEGSQVGLSQTLMNLISNSLDALPSDGKILIHASRKYENNNERLLLKIQDNGKGMPQEILNRIFDPFFTTKDVGKGTGLGLFIVQKEVDRHHGKLSVESEIGKGTTFTLDLPRISSKDLNVQTIDPSKKGAA